MSRWGCVLFFLASLLLPARAHSAGAGGLEAHGYLQTDLSGQVLATDPLADTEGRLEFAGSSLLALQMRNLNREVARFDGGLDLVTLYGRYAGLATGTEGADAVLTGAPILWELRRLSLSLFLPVGDLELGRQLLSFGQGRVYSPIDVFSSVDLLELNFRRRGSDALRYALPIGMTGGLEAVVGFPIADLEHSTALKVFGQLAGWDVAVVAIHQHRAEQTLAALTFKGDLGVGLSGELVPRYAWRDDAVRLEAMLGVDYSIQGVLVLSAEYYYRDKNLEAHPLYDTHNLFALATVKLGELSSAAISGLSAWPSERILLTGQWQHSLLQNADLALYARRYVLESLGTSIPDFEVGSRLTVKF